MNTHAIKTLLAASLSPFAVSAAIQADATETGNEQDFSLETIVVTATRTEEKLEDVAASISVISTEQLERTLVTDIRDMLRYQPGVEATNAGRFGLSGFNIRGLTGNRVKILVDGTEQSKGFSSGPWLNSPRNFVDVDSLAQVEILRGPASSLYGSDALAGVVSFRTKSPAAYLDEAGNDTGGHAKILYDSVDESFSETFTLANRSGDLETMVQYTRRDGKETENYVEGYAAGQGNLRELPNPYDYGSDNFLAKIEYQVNEANRLNLIGEYFRSKSHIDLLTLEGPTYNAMFNYSDYSGDDTFERKHIGLTHELDANISVFDTLVWTIDWQKSDALEETRNTTAAFGYGRRLIDYRHGEENVQLSAQFDKEVGAHHLTYGFLYQYAEQENTTDKFYLDGTRPDELARYTPVVKGDTIGIFLQDQITLLNGDLILSPGIRYDSFKAKPETDERYTDQLEDHSSDKITFRSGLVYKFDQTFSVFGQFAQGFKAPDLVQLYHEDQTSITRGYITLSNPDLKPESSESFELGFRAGGEKGNFEIVGFHSSYDDFISQDLQFVNGIMHFQYKNLSEATIKGIEARAAVWLDQTIGAPQGLAFQAAIAYAKGNSKVDGVKTPIDSVAPTKAVFGLTYDSPSDKWGAGLNATLVGSKSNDRISGEDMFSTDSYATFDITAYYNLTEAMSLRAGFFNITDKEYFLWEDVRGYAADTSYINRFTQPGRNASLSLQYRF